MERYDEFVMQPFPDSRVPTTPVGRRQAIVDLATPRPMVDEDGEPTGEYVEPVLDPETAKRLLTQVDD